MPVRFAKLISATALLLLAMWGLNSIRESDPRPWSGSPGKAGPVRILQFYATVGAVLPGQKAMLCYGVENAKSVRISPLLRGVYPASRHCVEVVPEHTTHYTILAEGFDGTVASRSLTLPVQAAPRPRPQILHFAFLAKPWQMA